MGENSGVSQSNDRVSKEREQRVHNTLSQNIKDTAIEKAKERQARLDKEKCRLNVEPRTQPLRGVVTENEISYVNSSSEDAGLSSDDSNSPYQWTDVVNSMTGASDTEMQELEHSDAEENYKRFKKAKKNLKKK